MRAFEDFTVGETIDHGQRTVTADEIVAFAREYDPQPFHLDAETPGGLIASGWHIAGLFMRLMVRHHAARVRPAWARPASTP